MIKYVVNDLKNADCPEINFFINEYSIDETLKNTGHVILITDNHYYKIFKSFNKRHFYEYDEIRDEILQWFVDNVEVDEYQSCSDNILELGIIFFKKKDDALKFKLVWG